MEINEAVPEYKRHTYADYISWDDSERCELIDGVIYAMSAPSWQHQLISGKLFNQIANSLTGKPCVVFNAPFDVRLNADSNDDTVVQPDIVVICDRLIIGGTGCIGTPDMLIEILSPSSKSHDKLRKLKLYQNYGVKEYWIVNPEIKTVSKHILDNGRYNITHYDKTEQAPISVLEGCSISLPEVFEEWK